MLNVTKNPFMLSVIVLNVVILSVPNKPFMLNVIMLNVVMLNVFMPIVVAPHSAVCHSTAFYVTLSSTIQLCVILLHVMAPFIFQLV
jgi:hypothetical protein